MTAQVLLTAGLVGAWIYVFVQSGLSLSFRFAIYAVLLCGTYFVWLPTHATTVANLLGIGRGADLVFYLWIVVSLAVLINLHLKLRRNLILLTQLARHLAIAQPLAATPPASDADPSADAAQRVSGSLPVRTR